MGKKPLPKSKAAIENLRDRLAVNPPAKAPTIVAEGDSWFNYPVPGAFDVVDWLRCDYGYCVHDFSNGGDELQDMVYGMVRGDGGKLVRKLDAVIACVARAKPMAFVFSGGGNDIVGRELKFFLNRGDSGLPPLRADRVAQAIAVEARRAYEEVLARTLSVSPATVLIVHGYAVPWPTGKAVINAPPRFKFIGPWLKPAFDEKGIEGLTLRRQCLRGLIDAFNAMLADFAAVHPDNVRHLDFRAAITRKDDWVNELHLVNDLTRFVAKKFHFEIKKLAH